MRLPLITFDYSLVTHNHQPVIATMEVIQLEKAVQNLSLSLAKVNSDTNSTLEGIQVSLNLLARDIIR